MFQILREPGKSEGRRKQVCLVGYPLCWPKSDAILVWQIENLAAIRTFFPESFCQPRDHRSPVLKRSEHFGFDVSLTPSCRYPAFSPPLKLGPRRGCLGNPLRKLRRLHTSQSRPLHDSGESYSLFGNGKLDNLPESTGSAE